MPNSYRNCSRNLTFECVETEIMSPAISVSVLSLLYIVFPMFREGFISMSHTNGYSSRKVAVGCEE